MTSGLDKPGTFAELRQQLGGVLEGERDGIANCANTAALIYHALPALNWAGFYFLRGEQLVLGPFQGKVACVRIPLGRGVCGTAAARLGNRGAADSVRRSAGRSRYRQPASRSLRSRRCPRPRGAGGAAPRSLRLR
jgi:putative methionine-R-sulfoxide reductase with GAF domain